LKDGGSTDPEKNATLAAALRTAKVSGVPKDNIERALARVRYQVSEECALLSHLNRPAAERIGAVNS